MIWTDIPTTSGPAGSAARRGAVESPNLCDQPREGENPPAAPFLLGDLLEDWPDRLRRLAFVALCYGAIGLLYLLLK